MHEKVKNKIKIGTGVLTVKGGCRNEKKRTWALRETGPVKLTGPVQH